ncbi:MAG: hypothetical protein IJE63_07535, partial [Clostridia bacterium]|nr:hypothetical protein [Clostridia bacterium]
MMDFWMLRMPTGCRLSNPKRRKAAKIHAFGRVRITLATLTVHNFSTTFSYGQSVLKKDFYIKPLRFLLN